jgi:prefoldin subunit 5
VKQKLKENLDNNLTSYILSTKAKEQKIMELLEIINQYESQITSLNNQIKLLTSNNKQLKEILQKIEFNYDQNKKELNTEKEI